MMNFNLFNQMSGLGISVKSRPFVLISKILAIAVDFMTALSMINLWSNKLVLHVNFWVVVDTSWNMVILSLLKESLMASLVSWPVLISITKKPPLAWLSINGFGSNLCKEASFCSWMGDLGRWSWNWLLLLELSLERRLMGYMFHIMLFEDAAHGVWIRAWSVLISILVLTRDKWGLLVKRWIALLRWLNGSVLD